MRLGPPTGAELRSAFARIMGDIRAGRAQSCPTGLGFDQRTMEAINAFALDPKRSAVLAAQAQTVLSQQVAGFSAAADDAAIQQLLEEA